MLRYADICLRYARLLAPFMLYMVYMHINYICYIFYLCICVIYISSTQPLDHISSRSPNTLKDKSIFTPELEAFCDVFCWQMFFVRLSQPIEWSPGFILGSNAVKRQLGTSGSIIWGKRQAVRELYLHLMNQ